MYMENVSNHYPTSLTMKMKLEKTIIKTISKSANNHVTRINLNKVDKQQYACSAANKLLNMDSVINSMDLNKTVYTINKLLTEMNTYNILYGLHAVNTWIKWFSL